MPKHHAAAAGQASRELQSTGCLRLVHKGADVKMSEKHHTVLSSLLGAYLAGAGSGNVAAHWLTNMPCCKLGN
jgi:hypothetical protein